MMKTWIIFFDNISIQHSFVAIDPCQRNNGACPTNSTVCNFLQPGKVIHIVFLICIASVYINFLWLKQTFMKRLKTIHSSNDRIMKQTSLFMFSVFFPTRQASDIQLKISLLNVADFQCDTSCLHHSLKGNGNGNFLVVGFSLFGHWP